MEILVRLLNPLIMIAMPLALAVILVQRLRVSWRLFAIGAAGFFASQVLHVPFNILVLYPGLEMLQAKTWILILGAVLAGLSAGLFEEFARYLILRFWLDKERSWDQMVMYGLGHGGFEAMLLGTWGLYSFFQAFALRNADLTALVQADQLPSVVGSLTIYWEVPWTMALLGALERLFAICLHLGLTALVWQAVVRRSIAWLGLAIIWHTLANAAALLINQAWGAYFAEGFLALTAGISLYFLFALRRRETAARPASEIEPLRLEPDSKEFDPTEGVTQQILNNSRYMD